MKKNKVITSLPVLLIGLGILLHTVSAQAQTPEGQKVVPTKTATINVKELEKASAAAPADTLKRRKVENKNQIFPELRLPRGAKIMRHKPPQVQKDTTKFEIREKGKSDNEGLQPNFPGLIDNGGMTPPDIGAAVGHNHLMVALNTQVRIQNKTGATISTVTLNAFFASLGAHDMFDPKVVYDPFARRWIITAAANSFSAASSMMIGVSDTNDPTGNWHLYQFDADAANATYFDYPNIGFNRNWIVVTGNMFTVAGGNLQNAAVYIFDKAALYAGTATPTFLLRSPTTEGYSICPAITLDNTQNTEYLVTRYQYPFGTLRISTITGTPSAPVYTATMLFPAAASGWWNIPPNYKDFAPQSTVTDFIDTGDDRIRNAVFRNGSLWCTHTIFLPTSVPTRSAVQWWQINPVTGMVLQNARIDDATAANFFAYPSIAVNAYNDVLIGYSSFSSTQFASCNFSFRLRTDALNTLRPTVQFRAGLAKYVKIAGGNNRWGDYSSTCIDPDDFSMWTIQEYAENPVLPPGPFSDRWGTEWNRVVPPVPEVFSKDSDDDFGAEPNPTPSAMCISPDIWVRKVQDAPHAFAHIHENGEYRTGTSNPNYVYIEVRNRGSVASAGTEKITLYWAKAGSYLQWPDPWKGGVYFDPGPNTMLMGDVISSQTIPAIAAGSSTILEFAWNPANPEVYATVFDKNHFCLLARITTGTASPFGMTFTETGSINDNVRNNNNIVWKNIGVYDLLPGTSAPAEAVVGNMTNDRMNAKFKFELLDQNGNLGLFDKGMLKVTPAGKLREILKERPARGEGIRQNADGTILVTQQGAVMEGVAFNPRDFGVLKIEFVPATKNEKMTGYAINFTQLADINGTDQVIGGQTFVYGQVKGFLTQPDGGGGIWKWWWWWLIVAILGLAIWVWRRK